MEAKQPEQLLYQAEICERHAILPRKRKGRPAGLPLHVLWSGQRDSNPRMTAWEAVALPLGDARICAMKLAWD